ncbi:helix-turn-helix transcriptional regulator [Methylobacterium sp. R2-1]|uniref:helix-turn-helix transcriptional regulator n=1 Tax=Methylobacterium sp. R2-1 TaxID=2587064 RepID=UPI0016160FBC|nr:helix-turn-helix transcriptional regulator [Methylobacterium sp. R2-1]MBB2961075.1 DNA-binding CsgD family transcriptional regulator [Methylobacterium sp. R2-1]
MPDKHALLNVLDKVGSAAVLINYRARTVDFNNLARRIVWEDAADMGPSETEPFTSRMISNALTEPFGTVELERPRNDQRLVFQAMDITAMGEAHRLLILIDLAVRTQVCAPALEKIFGLTAAEGRLAAELSRGIPLATIAQSRNVSIATLRTQLASIFGKTGTSRQPELVALLARVCQFSPMSDVAR